MREEDQKMVEDLHKKAKYTDQTFNNSSLGSLYQEAAARITALSAELGTAQAEIIRISEDRDNWKNCEAICSDQFDQVLAEVEGLTSDGYGDAALIYSQTLQIQALSAELEAERGKVERRSSGGPVGWLIEHEDEPKWITLRPAEVLWEVCWTKDSLEALRFARRSDAEDYVAAHFDGEGPMRITEHAWDDGPTQERRT